jgi:hypothetical protein
MTEMANVDTTNLERREPEIFAAGDTLSFERYWPEYPASQGWFLEGVLTNLSGQIQPLSAFQSVADIDSHEVVVQNYADALPEGDYILAEYVVLPAGNVNGYPAARHEVYRKVFKLNADLANGLASKPLKTMAQQMIETIQGTLQDLYGRRLKETDQERTHFVLQEIDKMEASLFKWQEKRNNEVQFERARAGEPPGNVALPMINVGA